MRIHTQLTFEQHKFKLRGSTYMQIFFSRYGTINVFYLPYDLLNNSFLSLADFKNTVYNPYTKYVSTASLCYW